MQDGLVPYVDMFDHKGILLFWLEQLGIVLGSGNLTIGVWILESLFYIVTVVYLLRSLLFLTDDFLVSSTSISLFTGVAVIVFEGGNLSEPFALMFIAIGFYLIAKTCLEESINHYNLFAIGLTGGLTFFIRPNMIALWFVFCLYLVISNVLIKEYKKLTRQVLLIFAGGLIVCVIVILYGVVVGNLSQMIYQTLTLNFQYSSAASFSERYLVGREFFEFATLVGITPFLILYLVFLVSVKKEDWRKEYTFYIALLIYLVVNFTTVIMSGRYYLHYFITMLVPVIVLTGIGIGWGQAVIKGKSKKIITTLLLFFIPLSSFSIAYRDVLKPTLSAVPNQTIDSDIVKTAEYIKEHSTKKDTIYVHNTDANIYLLSDRYSNSRFFVLPDINYQNFYNLKQEFENNLKKSPPKYIVVKKELYNNQSHLTDAKLDKTLFDEINKYYEIVPDYQSVDFALLKKMD